MDAPTTANKPAPVKMVHFMSELIQDLALKGRVVSVEVGEAAYLVTVAVPHRGLSVHELSAWDVSRSMRGDPSALAAIRADLSRDANP
jgi:hypothetical protein